MLEASQEYFRREMAYGFKAEAPPMTDRAAGHVSGAGFGVLRGFERRSTAILGSDLALFRP